MGNNWEADLKVAGSAGSITAAFLALFSYSAFDDGSIITALLLGVITLCAVGLSVMLLHASSLNPAESHTLTSLLVTYLINELVVHWLGMYCHRALMKTLRDPQRHQDDLLMSILRLNAGTAFSKDKGLDKIKDREEFLTKFPLTDYTAYAEYVERIAQGEDNVMTKAKVKYLCVTSGTTGKNKMYPYTFSDFSGIVKAATALSYSLYGITGGCHLSRVFNFRLHHPSRSSPCGLPIGGMGLAMYTRLPAEVNPDLINRITTEATSYFIQALFALQEPELYALMGYSSDLILAFFKSIEENREPLCKALASGHIDSFPGLAEDVREAANKLLTANPQRADEVHQELTRGSDRLAKRLWPSLQYAALARSGGFAHCAAIMEKTYYKDLKIVSGMHSGTEGIYGVSTSGEDIMADVYTFIPGKTFLEFIKVEDMENEDPKTYLLPELQIGQMYEMVCTNAQGLYRNRFGDVIQVVGFTENTPKYTFQYRSGQILNCSWDRTPEKVLYDALKLTEAKWNKASIKNYTATESVHLEQAVEGLRFKQNHYVVFLETEQDVQLSEAECNFLEDDLLGCHESYREFREQGSIGAVQITQVVKDTFDELRHLLWGENPNMQYKTPRVLRRHDVLQFLWDKKLNH